MRLIETKTLTSAQTSIEFINIPQIFDDLFIKLSLRAATGTSYYLDVGVFVNNQTSTAWRGLYAVNTSPATNAGNFNISSVMNGITTTSNTFSNSEIYIPSYRSTGTKLIISDSVAENNSSTQYVLNLSVNSIVNSAAITQITIQDAFGSASFDTNSSVSLYGITKGSDGIVTTTP
jgi:hypothetical protein